MSVAPFVIGVLALLATFRSRTLEVDRPAGSMPANPLQIWPALQMAATFQVVLIVVRVTRYLFGDLGLQLSAAVLGISDVDALTISMAQSASAGVTAHVAARAIAIGILANTILKTGLILVLGTRPFRTASVGVLAAMMTALVASMVLLY